MDLTAFPDWSRVGRRIGKKLRDILNPPVNQGPSKEERRAQRLRDARKGFAYFDSFDEVIQWSLKDVDPIQQANTPLLRRSTTAVHDQTLSTTRLMLCHDYKGGYHEYESSRPRPLENELYSCEYLQYVDTFIYFSHKLVCCPPPTWINVLHRNGVKVLGTFIIEPQTHGVEEMLEFVDGGYIIAQQLASMADTFGFDGWLLNIEQEFPNHVKNLTGKLVHFIESLKRYLGPDGVVVWYDALTTENEVDYQNGLSMRNAPFAQAADALFTNYRWTKTELSTSKMIADQQGLNTSNIYFGIDVWAQNTNMPGPPRITFPAKGGGGTKTGLAMGVLAQEGFSTAVFAPAWTYEHFPICPSDHPNGARTLSMARSVERALWEGCQLPVEVCCNCHGRPHHTGDYRKHPILHYARESPAGSLSYLYTDFTKAFLSASNGVRSCLSSQAVFPHVEPTAISDNERLDDDPSTQALDCKLEAGLLCVRVIHKACQDVELRRQEAGKPDDALVPKEEPTHLCLFKLNMPGDGSLCANAHFACSNVSGTIGFYSAYQGPNRARLGFKYHAVLPGNLPAAESRSLLDSSNTASIRLRGPAPEYQLVEFGVFCQGCSHGKASQVVMMVQSVGIASFVELDHNFHVVNISVAQQKKNTDAEMQLTWQWEGNEDRWPEGLPWSKTTGPFSHFAIFIDGEDVGTAHSLKFPLREEGFGRSEEKRVVVSIDGHLFGGGTIASSPMTFLRNELWPRSSHGSWYVVEDECLEEMSRA